MAPVGLMLPNDLIVEHQLAGMNFVWSLGNDDDEAAAKLFAGLRYFDDRDDIATILVAELAHTSANAAYNNRLGKSSSGQKFNVTDFM